MFKNRSWAVAGFFFFGLLAILVLVGCGSSEEIHTLEQPICEEIVFQSDDEPVDAFFCRPAGPQVNLPAVIYLHGAGAFETPPPEIIPDVEDAMPYTIHRELAEQGFVAMSILYHSRTPPPEGALEPNTFIIMDDMPRIKAWPTWISTFEDGLSYMQSRPEVDPDRIGLVGYSQGGSLAIAFDQDQNNYAALILISGYYDTGWANFTAGDTPTLILHAEVDEWIPLSDALMIKDSLDERGIEHEFVVIEGADHRWIGQEGKEGFDVIVAFLESYLSPSGP